MVGTGRGPHSGGRCSAETRFSRHNPLRLRVAGIIARMSTYAVSNDLGDQPSLAFTYPHICNEAVERA